MQFDAIKTDDILLSMNSLDWITSLLTVLFATFHGSMRVITTQPFSPAFLLSIIEEYKVTFMINPPYHMVSLLKCDQISKQKLQSIRLQVVIGAKVFLDALNEYNSYLTNGSAVAAYGISEMSCVTIDWPRSGKDTIGQLIGGLSVKIIDENDNRCGIDTEGGICIKNATKTLGYCGCEELTKAAFDDEGFFHTGDIGRIDKDGNFFIVDREKDLLKYCSRKFSPSDVEAFLICSPDINAVCVIGVPDVLAGDLPAALIVRKPNSQLSEGDIFKMVAGTFY